MSKLKTKRDHYFRPYMQRDGKADPVFALDVIDERLSELWTALDELHEMVVESGSRNKDTMAALLTSALALLGTAAEPIDLVSAALVSATKPVTAPTHPPGIACSPASAPRAH